MFPRLSPHIPLHTCSWKLSLNPRSLLFFDPRWLSLNCPLAWPFECLMLGCQGQGLSRHQDKQKWYTATVMIRWCFSPTIVTLSTYDSTCTHYHIIYIYMYVCVYIYICICVCVFKWLFVFTRIYALVVWLAFLLCILPSRGHPHLGPGIGCSPQTSGPCGPDLPLSCRLMNHPPEIIKNGGMIWVEWNVTGINGNIDVMGNQSVPFP